jgi:hypothetical protein
MYYNKTEMMFPPQAISGLRDLRGKGWQKLVDRVSALPEMHPDKLAFMLMMVRLDGCLKCASDSYRALRGCDLCARQTVARFKGSDGDLCKQFELAREDVLKYLESKDMVLKKAA